jgi:hypothetical protein
MCTVGPTPTGERPGHQPEENIMATTITARTFESGQWIERNIEIKFVKRTYGGYRIVRADNGRDLGWVTPGDTSKWQGYVASSAFRGISADDEGDILDDVPLHLFNGRDAVSANPSAHGRTREEVADEIVYRLVREHAPAVGFGAHFGVTPYRPRVQF